MALWYTSRSWASPGAFTDTAGSNDQSDWHFIEVYFATMLPHTGDGSPIAQSYCVDDLVVATAKP